MYCCCHVDLPRLNHGLFYFSIIFSQRIEALGERKNSVIIEVEESKVASVAKIIGSCYNFIISSLHLSTVTNTISLTFSRDHNINQYIELQVTTIA